MTLTTIPILARIEDAKPVQIRDENAQYRVETDEWRKEMLASKPVLSAVEGAGR